nr:iron-sulfur cluster repair di-iron protein [uncultured Dyadobacter sp.]
METIPTLNVTVIEPRFKHATIFEHFDALLPGQAFVIFNDHDPGPLYDQLLGERGDVFTWNYLQQGPEYWQVKITKQAAEGPEETVGQIASKDIRKADAFRKLGIDFCCGGKKKLRDALRDAGVTPQQFEETLAAAAALPASQQPLNFASWQPGFLADYIVNVHHQYVRESGPVITGLAAKVAARHGDHHPELFALSEQVQVLVSDLYSHLEKEERVLFPAIKALAQGTDIGNTPDLNLVIGLMEAEHESAGDDLKNLRRITSDYQLPQGACNSYTYLFEKLKEFENDLFNHIHLENNILFPKALHGISSN